MHFWTLPLTIFGWYLHWKNAEGALNKAEEQQIEKNTPDDSSDKSTSVSGMGRNTNEDDLRSPNSLGSPVSDILVDLWDMILWFAALASSMFIIEKILLILLKSLLINSSLGKYLNLWRKFLYLIVYVIIFGICLSLNPNSFFWISWLKFLFKR